MGNLKSTLQVGEHPTDNRRRSQQSMNELIKPAPAPIKPVLTPIKPPPAVVPVVKEEPKQMELSERDIAFLCSQTGKKDETC